MNHTFDTQRRSKGASPGSVSSPVAAQLPFHSLGAHAMLSWLDTHTLTLISLETMLVSVIGGLLLLVRLRGQQRAASASTSASGASTTEASAQAQRLLDALPLEAPAIAHLRAR
ncbi:MAG: hypothetical protein O2851_03715, partial [Proteobacteria bacterium]|nr:hypothetical protein [Pseudomonadota bacterium]